MTDTGPVLLFSDTSIALAGLDAAIIGYLQKGNHSPRALYAENNTLTSILFPLDDIVVYTKGIQYKHCRLQCRITPTK